MTNYEVVYGAFIDYFGDIEMGLIKTVGQHKVYASKISSGLLNQNRYIFVVVPQSRTYELGNVETLNNLDWVSFQTRMTEEVHAVPEHGLYSTPERKKMLNDKVKVVERTKDETFYLTNSLPIRVRVLHDPKKKNSLQYPDEAYLYQLLESYRCVIELL